MRKITATVWIVLLAGVLSVQLGCRGDSRSRTVEDKEAAVVPVEAALVTHGDIANYFTGTATLEADKETQVMAKVGGVVKRIEVEEGDYVHAGQVLAKLDDEKLSVQMEQATASLNRLETEYERARELFEAQLVSAQEFQEAKYEYDHQKATYDLCRLDLEYTSIHTPITGVVAERMIKVGNMVLPNQAVFRVTDLDPLLAVLHVPEQRISRLRVGQVAGLRVDAVEGREFSGQVSRISPVVDPSTGTIKITVEVHDATRQLKPGMFARIDIVHDVHAGAMLLPRDALIDEDNRSVVFVVRDSTAYKQDVETGYVNSTHVEVLRGLQLGDTVVTTGKGSLKDSTKVELVGAPSSQAIADHQEAAQPADSLKIQVSD
jgi:membrane fusion protein (multidrug efflux system)